MIHFQKMLQQLNQYFPHAKWLIPRIVRRFILIHFIGAGKNFVSPPSRRWLETVVLPILPELGFRRILFVGTGPYTSHYERIIRQAGGMFFTSDINPSAATWGSRKHVTIPIQQIYRCFDENFFDAVILNGVFGFGVNSIVEMNKSIDAIKRVLKCEGLLLLGWNTDVTADVMRLERIRDSFGAASALPFPAHVEFPGETHVYDFQICRKLPDRGDQFTAENVLPQFSTP
jgi:hypothetical protein